MIRVGFVLDELSDRWLGGINYYRSLFSALNLLTTRKLQPVVFIGNRAADSLAGALDGTELARCFLNDSGTAGRVAWKALRSLSAAGANIVLESMLARHEIAVLSHFGPLNRGSAIPTIGWIPDFQHTRIPEYFSRRQIRRRDAIFTGILRNCDRVMISSQAALSDLAQIAPEAVFKSRVLHFVPDINLSEPMGSLADLHRRYGISGPYFFLPNQFWKHKNHEIVVRALAELKQKGITATVIATGKQHDYRYPDHFLNLMSLVAELGLTDSFRALGVVPYKDLLTLMHHSVAVINPSLFEGWSTTVEEAKILGKAILLSDIPVHREQAPARGIYFEASSVTELARAISDLWIQPAGNPVSGIGAVDAADYFSNRTRFAQNYQDLVVDLVESVEK